MTKSSQIADNQRFISGFVWVGGGVHQEEGEKTNQKKAKNRAKKARTWFNSL